MVQEECFLEGSQKAEVIQIPQYLGLDLVRRGRKLQPNKDEVSIQSYAK